MKHLIQFHMLILGLGLTTILAIELWKFIAYISIHPQALAQGDRQLDSEIAFLAGPVYLAQTFHIVMSHQYSQRSGMLGPC